MWLEYYLLGTVFVLGAVIGSFLNVVIYRLHTGKSINGHSHCMSCGKRLRWFELFPIVSYLALRGRCRGCASYVPGRYLLVELVTAFSFVGLYNLNVDWVLFLILAALGCVLIVIVVYDYYHLIIPNELPIVIGILALLYHTYYIFAGAGFALVMSSLGAAFLGAGFYAFLWCISKGRWIGFGDAKLAFALGLFLPITAIVSMVILSFWIGAFVSLVAIGLQWILERGQVSLPFVSTGITMKSEIPFAPFIVAAFIATFFFSVDVMESTSYVLSLLY